MVCCNLCDQSLKVNQRNNGDREGDDDAVIHTDTKSDNESYT